MPAPNASPRESAAGSGVYYAGPDLKGRCRMRGNSRTAALTLVLLWAVPALAEDVTLSGTVTWDVVNAQSGYVLVFGLSEVGFSAQVPLDVDAGGHSGTYSLAVPPDDYVVYVNVGACPGIEN